MLCVSWPRSPNGAGRRPLSTGAALRSPGPPPPATERGEQGGGRSCFRAGLSEVRGVGELPLVRAAARGGEQGPPCPGPCVLHVSRD